jgi:BolA family transcriptional regulator, general stress-responsive regulator
MSERIEKMQSRLNATFAPLDCQLVDDSHLHAGHAGAASGAGHYSVRIVSDRFDGLNRVARHRLVYDCLRDMMTSDIHALNIIALAPSEVAK